MVCEIGYPETKHAVLVHKLCKIAGDIGSISNEDIKKELFTMILNVSNLHVYDESDQKFLARRGSVQSILRGLQSLKY